MKSRMWTAWANSAVSTPDGPLPVAKDEIVVVLVVPTWGEAFERLKKLLAHVPPAGDRG